MRDIVIIGGGPAGLTAAIYAARANRAPLVVEGIASGGQPMLAHLVENYPGFADGIRGPELVGAMRRQAARFGTEFASDDATSVDFSRRPFVVTTASGQDFEARAVIVASGASPNMLGVPGESRLLGLGVSTCATCDGYFFRNRTVVVVGGGDTAIEDALYLAEIARSVAVVHRREELRASKILANRAADHPKISFVWNSVVEEILGSERVTGVRLLNLKTSQRTEWPTDGVFLAIGHSPNTRIFAGQLDLTEAGHIRLYKRSMTSVEGVFAAGDAHDGVYRQTVTAAGYGAMAAIDADRWLREHKP